MCLSVIALDIFQTDVTSLRWFMEGAAAEA